MDISGAEDDPTGGVNVHEEIEVEPGHRCGGEIRLAIGLVAMLDKGIGLVPAGPVAGIGIQFSDLIGRRPPRMWLYGAGAIRSR